MPSKLGAEGVSQAPGGIDLVGAGVGRDGEGAETKHIQPCKGLGGEQSRERRQLKQRS